jgi:hypothetical protein
MSGGNCKNQGGDRGRQRRAVAAGVHPREARPSSATQQGAVHRPTGPNQNLGPPSQQKPSLGFLYVKGLKRQIKVPNSL